MGLRFELREGTLGRTDDPRDVDRARPPLSLARQPGGDARRRHGGLGARRRPHGGRVRHRQPPRPGPRAAGPSGSRGQRAALLPCHSGRRGQRTRAGSRDHAAHRHRRYGRARPQRTPRVARGRVRGRRSVLDVSRRRPRRARPVRARGVPEFRAVARPRREDRRHRRRRHRAALEHPARRAPGPAHRRSTPAATHRGANAHASAGCRVLPETQAGRCPCGVRASRAARTRTGGRGPRQPDPARRSRRRRPVTTSTGCRSCVGLCSRWPDPSRWAFAFAASSEPASWWSRARPACSPTSILEIVEAAAREQGATPVRVLTYLANALRVGDRSIPYSTVSALDLPTYLEAWVPHAPDTRAAGQPRREVVDRPRSAGFPSPPGRRRASAAEGPSRTDLAAGEGSRGTSRGRALPPLLAQRVGRTPIAIGAGRHGHARLLRVAGRWRPGDGQAEFVLAGVVPMDRGGAEPTLTPSYPGLTDSTEDGRLGSAVSGGSLADSPRGRALLGPARGGAEGVRPRWRPGPPSGRLAMAPRLRCA